MNRFSYRKGLIALIFMIAAIAPFAAYQQPADAATTPAISTNKSVYFPGTTTDGQGRTDVLFQDEIIITVRDGDSNISTSADSITLTITSAVGGGSVTKVLEETSTAGVFTDDRGVRFVTSVLSQSGGALDSFAALLITRPSDTVTLRFTNVSGSTGTATADVRSNTGSFTGTSTSILGTSTITSTNARIVLTDPDLNRSSSVADTFPVRLRTQLLTGVDAVTVVLTETGANTGVFSRSGRIVNSDATSNINDLSLTQPDATSTFLVRARSAGDTITVDYSTAATDPTTTTIGPMSDVTSDFTFAGTSQTITYGLGTQGTIVLSATEYRRGNSVRVTITDPDLNTSSASIQSFTAPVSASTISGDGNIFVMSGASTLIALNSLTETGLNTGIFTGLFTFTSDTTFSDSADTLPGGAPATFTVTYDDTNPGTGTSGTQGTGLASASFQFLTATGTLTLSPSSFQDRSVITITLTDSDLNTSDTSIQTRSDVVVTSIFTNTTADTVQPTLTETGVATGIFTGTFTINFGSGTTNLDTTSSGTATATYTDTLNSAGTTTTITATAVAGQTPGVMTVSATEFNLTGVATLTLSDPDLNTSSSTIQSLTGGTAASGQVWATNTSQPTVVSRALFMRETGANTGLFTGTLAFTTSSTATASRSGDASLGAVLQVLPGNTLRVRYTDAAPSGTADVSLSVPAHTGTIDMDATIIQNQGRVTVTVTDPDLNSSASVPEQATVAVNSTTSIGTAITVTLTETGVDTGIFTGTFATIGDGTDTGTTITPGDTTTPNGPIAVSNGDGVTATYTDQQDAAGVVRSVPVSRIVRMTDGTMEILAAAGTALTNNQASAGDRVLLRYTDPDLNTNTDLVQSITGAFFSSTDLTGISVVMFETGVSTGVFTKDILLSSTTSAASASLKVSTGDTITARFVDTTPSNTASGVTSEGIVRTATATIVTPGAPVLTPETATIGVGETLPLTAAGVGPFTYTSSDTAVASVSTAGLVTGVAAGTATITVRSTTTSLTDTSVITVVTEVVSTGAAGSRDFDGNGTVEASDAAAVLNAFATGRALTSAQIASSDTDGNGRLNSDDALDILIQVARAAAPAAQAKAAKKATVKEQVVGAVRISASSVSAVRGATGVTVSVSPDVDIPRLGSVSMTITYDRNVLTATAATAVGGGTTDISTPGTVRVALAVFPGVDVAAGGSIADITFGVLSTAAAGDTSIAIELDALSQAPAAAAGERTNLLPNATAQAGTFTVTAPIPVIVLPNFSTQNFFSFLFLANPNAQEAEVTIMARPTGGGDAVTATRTSIAARTNVVEQIDTILPGITGGYISITSNRSLGAVIAMLGSNFQTLDVVSAAASGTTLTFPALVTDVGDFATSIILVNHNDAAANVTITANQGGSVLATSSVTTIPAMSNIVRTLDELFPTATFTNIGFDANVVVTSDVALSGAATLGSSGAGLLATGIANAR